jgi:hypothetical protein
MFALASLLLLGFGYQAEPAQSKTEPNHTANTQDLPGEKTKKSQSGCQNIVVQQTCDSISTDEKPQSQARKASDQPHDWIDKLNAFSTLIIAVFTVLLFGGVAVQISTSRDTERAWVIANPTDNAPVVGFIPSGESNLEGRLVGANKRNIFGCSFKTTGNSPARLVETAIRYYKVDKLEDIPREPDYGARIPLNDLPLVPGDSIGFVQLLEPSAILNRTDSAQVGRQECFLYAFGIMVYRDAYKRLHETRFGFVYHFPLDGDPRDKGFRRDGLPEAYNRAT